MFFDIVFEAKQQAKHQLNLKGGDLIGSGWQGGLLSILLGTTHFLVHHIYPFMIYVTILILLKFQTSYCNFNIFLYINLCFVGIESTHHSIRSCEPFFFWS